MNILILCSSFPYPPTKGRKQLRTFHFLQYLNSGHQITLLTRLNSEVTDAEIEALQEQVTELVIFPTVQQVNEPLGLIKRAKRLGTFIQQGTPPAVLDNYCPEMADWINQAIADEQFEMIVCEDSFDEIYIDTQWHEKLGIVLNLHFSEYGKYKQQLETGDSDNELKDQINLK